MKSAALNNLVLPYPNAQDPFILDTDAAEYSVGGGGGALMEVQNGCEGPISFAIKSLTPTQRNYCTTRRELLAVITFTRHYRHYLLGRKFVVGYIYLFS